MDGFKNRFFLLRIEITQYPCKVEAKADKSGKWRTQTSPNHWRCDLHLFTKSHVWTHFSFKTIPMKTELDRNGIQTLPQKGTHLVHPHPELKMAQPKRLTAASQLNTDRSLNKLPSSIPSPIYQMHKLPRNPSEVLHLLENSRKPFTKTY